uniref:Tick transposon n=1 Tax=Rhipicephalus zambeziensis TaxID=60191 RepID=A0A224Z127_9ACAR
MFEDYRKCIVKRSLASVERGQQPAGVTILDAMHYLASAWSAVTAATVEHCFNKCFGVRADDTTEAVGDGAFADCDELNTAMETVGASGIAYSDYASVDDAVVTSAMLSVDDIVAECADPCASDEEVEEEVERIPEPTFSSAVAALDLLRRYVRTSDDGESHMALQVLEKRLVLVGREKMRQAPLHDFFKRKN